MPSVPPEVPDDSAPASGVMGGNSSPKPDDARASAGRGVHLPSDAPPASGTATKLSNGKGQSIRARRPMAEWWSYFVAMALAVGLLAGPMIGQALEADVSHISAVILVIFIAAVVKNYRDIRFLAVQAKLANEQVAQLRKTNNIARFLAEAEPSLLRDHIANLYEVFRRDVNISQDNLVTLMQTRLLSRTRIVEFCSSALVTLGLVGTIIGLIQASGGLTQVFAAAGAGTGDSPDLLAGIDNTLKGMGIAFYTTLLGAILGGVFLRLLSNLVDANIDHIVSHIAELTEIYILPILRRAARINEEHQKHQREQALERGESIVDFEKN